jgi:spore germination protein KC
LLVCEDIQGIQDSNVSLEVFNSKSNIKPEYSDGKLTMAINITTEVAVGESGSRVDYRDKAGMASLKKNAEEFLVQNIMRVIRKVQDEFDTDIFGFGKSVSENLPDVWKKFANGWDTEFKELGFDITSSIKIRNTALAVKTLEGAE